MLKKWVSTILAVSMVVSMAAVLNACAGKKTEDPAETTPEESTTAEDNDYKSFFEELMPLEGDEESYSYTELVTDEHYAEEYERLTLPTAAATTKASSAKTAKTKGAAQKAAATTAAARATTKPFQFASPKDRAAAATTTKAAAATTKAAESTTAKTENATGVSDTTILNDQIQDENVAFQNGIDPANIQELPPVRYLQKYMIDILSDDSYTMQTEYVSDGMAIPVTIYKDANNLAYEMTVSELMAAYMQQEFSVLGKIAPSSKIKFILKDANSSNPGMYLCLPSGYIDFREVVQSEGDSVSAEDIKQEFQTLIGGADQYVTREYGSLEYINTIVGDNYVCESYRTPDKNTGYSFYFTSRGLARIEEVDLSTNKVTQSTKMILTRGVSDKKAFETTGKKMDMDAIRKLFGIEE